MLSVKYQTLLPHIVSVVGQNAKLCPPLKAPLGEDNQDKGGEKKEKHLLAWPGPDPGGLGGSTLEVNQMEVPGGSTLQQANQMSRTRKTDPGSSLESLEIRLRKTDTAMPKHAGAQGLAHVAYN